MFTPRLRGCSLLCVFCSILAVAQQAPSPAPAMAVRELPMVFESNVVAGKTPVGTKIKAKLSVATLVKGTVIPKNAVFGGEVIESVTKTDTAASRLAIRMDSAQWKDGSASMKAYLTGWYYPTLSEAGAQNLQYGPTQPANRTWNGEGQYPDPNSHIYRPFPGTGGDQTSSVPDATASVTSSQRAPLKDVETAPSNDGGIALVSRKINLKVDKLTTYVFATADVQLPPEKPASNAK